MSVRFNRASRRSETFRRGSPDSHEDAVQFICDFIGRNMYDIFDHLVSVHAPLNLTFADKFRKENKGLMKKYPAHSYDLGCMGYNKKYTPMLIVEVGDIGDDSKHNLGHKDQLINDGIAKKFIEEYYPDCKFIRINKDDAMIETELIKRLWKTPP